MALRRRVYYLSGFDPRGAAFYQRLFREEARKSAELAGAQITVGKRTDINVLVSGWQVEAVRDAHRYETDYRFLRWDDLVRARWVGNVALLIARSLPFHWIKIKDGQFGKYRAAGRGPYLTSILPVSFVAAMLVGSAAVAWLVYRGADALFDSPLASVLAAGAIVYASLGLTVRLGRKAGLWWILQAFVFVSRWSETPVPELDRRMQQFAQQILADQDEAPAEEIFLVGHCVGAMLAVGVLANILNESRQNALQGNLTLITLGQCIPYLSYAPAATHFRAALQRVADAEQYAWFDFGARADPLCFQQVNPALADGVHAANPERPCRIVVRPFQMFSAQKYRVLKRNKLRLHFQYLMAADIRTDYDYFDIVAGHAALLNRPTAR